MCAKNSPKTALIVFAREPKWGKVKTRLARDLPKPYVLRLYKAFVRDVVRVARQTPCDQRFLYYAGHGASIPFLKRTARPFQFRRQMGADLGERMYQAFAYCRKRGFDRTVIIGTDCVTLTPQDITRAFRQLKKHDCVLGPSGDGGYYLIGLREPLRWLFSGICWGTQAVFRQTLSKLRKRKQAVGQLRCEHDVDVIDDLMKLRRRLTRGTYAQHTRKLLGELN